MGKAKGLFWQSRNSRVHRKPKLAEQILYRLLYRLNDGTEKSTFALETVLPVWRNCLTSEDGCNFTGKLFHKDYRNLEESESIKLWPELMRSVIV